ncbi:cytochrome c biogenesis protein CcsA [Verrucomicrobiales bacterium]|nr:cytochrome c biogenesis protein CcsA [Verrucomicrobiales bacterium]MDC0291920.1 cytochrome c biogenesis protein CcsA [Verrucomicrobiales bacterium]MDC0322014.1 cytochrome c biogenesis protein CcsA [Verrucomicrobiales bacterium]
MSTKKQIREEASQIEAEEAKGEQGVRIFYLLVCLLLFACLIIASRSAWFLATHASNAKDISTPLESYEPWPESIVENFSNIRVQNGGRIKPAHTFARFALIQVNNSSKARFETQDGEKHKISAEEWMLDVLFRPDLAKDLPFFNVDDTEAIVAIGVPPKYGDSHRKRDRYSYNQIAAKRAELAGESGRITQKRREDPDYQMSRLEGITDRLATNVSFFEYMNGQFGFARKGEGLASDQVLPQDLKLAAQGMDIVGLLDVMPEMTVQQLMQEMGREAATENEKAIQKAFQLFFFFARSGQNLTLIPPPDAAEDQWYGVGDLLMEGLEDKSKRAWVKEELKVVTDIVDSQKAMWTALAELPEDASNDDREAIVKPVAAKFETLVDTQKKEAEERLLAKRDAIDVEIAAADDSLEKQRLQESRAELKMEGAKVEQEVGLYTSSYFMNSLSYFILGFILLAVSWLVPGSKFAKIFGWLAIGVIVLALGYNLLGITMRSIIRSRPPITNLYDTIIFITGVVVLLALMLEYFTRRGIGTIIASLSGVLGMFLSLRYEVKEAVDTMDPLQAVLDTNLWLATHVTTINIGYAAGMLASFLGIAYLLYRFLRPLPVVLKGLTGNGASANTRIFDEPKNVRDNHKLIGKMTYGIVCFCLIFSIIGTVLGGIWANYSWGRFWGWDPKENGALMICLWTLVILHMRMGGYIKDIGMAVFSIILGMIVTFSWWGVNNLGVGLHSYGFTDGVMKALFITWAESILIMACGFPLWLHGRSKDKLKKEKRERKRRDNEVGGDIPPLPGEV